MSAFQPQTMDDAQRAKAEAVRVAYEALQATLGAHLPPGRYAALATTELEASCMWAIKAISHESPNRVPVSEGRGGSVGDYRDRRDPLGETLPARDGLS